MTEIFPEILWENDYLLLYTNHCDDVSDPNMIPDGLWLKKHPLKKHLDDTINVRQECYYIKHSDVLAWEVVDGNVEINHMPEFADRLMRCIRGFSYEPSYAFMFLYDSLTAEWYDWGNDGPSFHVCMANYRPLFVTNMPELMAHDELVKWCLICDAILTDPTVHPEMRKAALSFNHDALPVLDGDYDEAVWFGEIIPVKEFIRKVSAID